MRVCDVVLNSVWYDPRVTKQIIEYDKQGIEVCVVGLEDTKTNTDEVNKLPGDITIVPIEKKYYRNNRTVFTIIKREYLIFKRVKQAIEQKKPDIIHANDLNALIPAYYAAKKLKCKLIYDTHEIFLENRAIATSKIKQLFWGHYEKRIIKKIDKLICVSHAAAEYLQKKYNIDEPMVVTNCAMNSIPLDFSKVVKNEKFEILNHGQFYEGRGYDIMLRAAELSPNEHIQYVLRGYGSKENELREYARLHHLNNVTFSPPVKVYELIKCAAKSHIGLAITEPTCLNFQLSISNKLFEYAAAGIPVIMSNIPEHQYINSKYHIGIVIEENSPQKLVEAVNVLYNNTEFYSVCRNNAIEMSKILTWENEFDRLLTLERSMIKEK